jgi:hypothetical protein
MAFVRLFDNPDGTQEQYDAARAQIDVSSDNMPEGALLHVAGPSPTGGWRVTEIWESEEAAQKFDAETILPILEQVGIQRPEPTVWQVHNLVMRGA